MSAGIRRMQLDTLRLYLIKIGGRVRQLLSMVRSLGFSAYRR